MSPELGARYLLETNEHSVNPNNSSRSSEFRTGGRQRRRVDALAQRVIHRQVTVGIQRHRPDGVVVIVRPTRCRGWAPTIRKIAREQRIYRRWDVIVLPRHQHGLIGELAAVEEKTTRYGS